MEKGLRAWKVGDEWKPIDKEISSAHREPFQSHKFEEFERDVWDAAEPRIRDEDIDRVGREAEIIEDPLAFYVPYHPMIKHFEPRKLFRLDILFHAYRLLPPGWGIYFRIKKMLSDFRSFVSKHSWPRNIGLRELWHVYFMTIFWHEMAHHVIEDIATWKPARYPSLSRFAEERFCEFNAFTTAEEQLSPPDWCEIPIPPPARIPKAVGKGHVLNRRLILSRLYYHWGRDDPKSYYRPRVEREAHQFVDGLWYSFWDAHRRAAWIGGICTRIYYTTK